MRPVANAIGTPVRVVPVRQASAASDVALAAPGAGDRLVLGGEAAAREGLATRLAGSYNRLAWATAPLDKLRLLQALAETRTGTAADLIKQAYQEQISKLPPMQQEALALRFRDLVAWPTTPGLEPLEAGKRAELLAFLGREFAQGNQPGHVRNGLGVALAVSASPEGTRALIQEYKATPADRRLTVLTLMSACPTEQLALFLTDEFDQAKDADARRDLMATLQEILASPLR